MKNCYLVVFQVNNNHYIQLAKSDSGEYALSAFKTVNDAIKQFESFKEKAKSPSYENHISGSLGIINLNPHIIEVPADNPETLRKYLIEDKPYHLKGGMFGVNLDVVGVKVKEEILNLSVFDVSKQFIKEVYEN